MERREGRGGTVSSESSGSSSSRFPPQQSTSFQITSAPDFSKSIVQEALEHLASIDLIKLCNEAKVEYCRAIRDLRSCGRYVKHVLNSCGHASLCVECSQRCDVCPICRKPIPKDGGRLQLRLYYECLEAGLITKRNGDRFLESEDGNQSMADVQRLYSLFDVAIENNLVSLVCHYVTDVCLDESAVSSDPVVACLLDEKVVKDWCKKKFCNIVADLHEIYNLGVAEMKMKSELLLKFGMHLTGLSNVLEVLESSFGGTLYPQLEDLHQLSENILKAKQHLEVMGWCVRHHFLDNIPLRRHSISSWRSIVHERKSAAVKRAWPDFANTSAEFDAQTGATLFIEDALSNLGIEQGYGEGRGEELEALCLQKDSGSPLLFRSKIEGMAGCYPFENLRNAVDLLFLQGSSDLAVAKLAIFLYYLFDRHWSTADAEWRHIVDDFAGTFGMTRQSVLESLTFYLLDDPTEPALQEACHLLLEIAGPTLHPKIVQVLLERKNPDAALMVLRWSGHDGLCAYTNSQHHGTKLVSLGEAVTAVRVRIECGLVTEAFMYQRTHCLKVREEQLGHGSARTTVVDPKCGHTKWLDQMEVLVTEICGLCIRRNFVDRMIELPWNSEEEKYLHKLLFDSAHDLLRNYASFLVVFYLQRYRYIEAYQVDRKLQSLEQNIISSCMNEEVVSRIKSTAQWRATLVDRCIELLPDTQRQQLLSGNMPDIFLPAKAEAEALTKSDFPTRWQSNSTSLLPDDPSLASPLVLPMDVTPLSSKKTSAFNTRKELDESSILPNRPLSFVRDPSLLHIIDPPTPNRLSKYSPNKDNLALIQISGRKQRGSGFPIDDIPGSFTGFQSTPLKELNKSPSRMLHGLSEKSSFQGERNSPDLKEWNRSVNHIENSHPSSPHGFPAADRIDRMNIPINHAITKSVAVPGKRLLPDRPWDPISSYGVNIYPSTRDSSVEDLNTNHGPRWRSDDTSEDEEEDQGSIRSRVGNSSATTARVGRRRSRFYS